MPKKNKTVATAKVIVAPTKQNRDLYYLLALLLTTTICFWGVFNCGFVNFDDEVYIQNNLLLHSLNPSEIFSWFFTGKAIYGGNYHPLVTLTNAIEYALAGNNPTIYHATNLLLHLLNTLLVFILIMKISRQNQLVAFVVALLFGIHPMHVESVAWISERKDVLYAAFYLGAILKYIQYLETKKKLDYALSIVLFLLSLLSKSMAVTLPVVLIAIDYYLKGGIKKADFLNKAPYLLLSLAFGFLAIYSQRSQGYIADYKYPLIAKVFLTSYSWVYYMVQLVVPARLSVLHPFPANGLPATYYLSGVIVVAIIVAVNYLVKNGELQKALVFGLLFYTLSIGIVLQFVPIGAANVCERYTYIPYIGLFYIVAMMLEPWYHKKKTAVTSVFVLVVLVFCGITISRIPVWQDGETLWRDATTKDPDASYSWFALGNILKNKKGDHAEIIEAYNKAIAISPNAPIYLQNRSVAKGDAGDITGAYKDINEALRLKPDFAEGYYNRGNLAEGAAKYPDAINDYTKAISLKPSYAEAWFNRAIAYKASNRYDSAVADYKSAITINPAFTDAYNNLGNIYVEMKNYTDAVTIYTQSLGIDAKQSTVYMRRAMTYIQIGKKSNACADISKAIELGEPSAIQAQQALCR